MVGGGIGLNFADKLQRRWMCLNIFVYSPIPKVLGGFSSPVLSRPRPTMVETVDVRKRYYIGATLCWIEGTMLNAEEWKETGPRGREREDDPQPEETYVLVAVGFVDLHARYKSECSSPCSPESGRSLALHWVGAFAWRLTTRKCTRGLRIRIKTIESIWNWKHYQGTPMGIHSSILEVGGN